MSEKDPIKKASFTQSQLADLVKEGVEALQQISSGKSKLAATLHEAKSIGFDIRAVMWCINVGHEEASKAEADEIEAMCDLYQDSLADVLPGFEKKATTHDT